MSRRNKKRSKRRRSQHKPHKQSGRAVQARGGTHGERPHDAQRKPSTVLTLDALAPLIVRSGRPFDSLAGAADAARFPPPSTVAGCLRTAWARETGQDFGTHLAELSISGPLLLDHHNKPLVPKPADALYFAAENSTQCVRGTPKAFAAGCDADLPEGLLPVQLTEARTGKPSHGPRWWALDDLLAFRRGEELPYDKLCKTGWTPAVGDRRTHVVIDPKTGVANEGGLFQTEGLVLAERKASDAAQNGLHLLVLRLLVQCEKPLSDCLVHLGGERRLAALEEPQSLDVWPQPPSGWLQRISAVGHMCLTLLTPSIFSSGYCPGWLDSAYIGSPPNIPRLRLQLCAVAVERWQAHSGWDLAAKQPRPSRKLVPAGTTYWFRILEGGDHDALHALWLANVSDLEQDRRDGFGLALPSAWSPAAAD